MQSQQVVHVRSDSETKLDELFEAVIRPRDSQVPLTVPMRLRNLPPSFFQQPSRSASHSREPSDAPHHPRAHSSPASLQHPPHKGGGEAPLPPGWEMAKTAAGQTYFLNHLTQTTTWIDPRKKSAPLPKGWEQATTLEGEVYFINHLDRTTSWLDPRIPAHLQNPPMIQSPSVAPHPSQQLGRARPPPPPLKLPPSGALLQQNLRVQSLEMEREQLRLRQQEIIRQELLLRQSLGEKHRSVDSGSLDSFLDGSTDFHARQESADSGLGLGPNYSLPNTPEDFLANLDDVDDPQSTDLGLDLQTSLDLGDDNMDTDDLVPSLQEELNADILSDVEALLSSNKDGVLTWL